MPTALSQIDGIRSALVGEFYSRFAVSDGFEFWFSDFVLSSRELISPDEKIISSCIVGSYAQVEHTANPDRIAKSAVMAACLDIPIVAVDLLADSSLLLTFTNQVTIRLPTDTPIVDWHWAITEAGGDPYVGCHIACFAPGDIQGGMPNNSCMDSSVNP